MKFLKIFSATDVCVALAAGGFPAHKRRRGFNTAQHMSQTVSWLEAMLEISLHSATQRSESL